MYDIYNTPKDPKRRYFMADVMRITPADARQKVLSGQALLVCAYPNHEKFLQYGLKGAISLSDLHGRENGLDRDREIIFYCN